MLSVVESRRNRPVHDFITTVLRILSLINQTLWLKIFNLQIFNRPAGIFPLLLYKNTTAQPWHDFQLSHQRQNSTPPSNKNYYGFSRCKLYFLPADDRNFRVFCRISLLDKVIVCRYNMSRAKLREARRFGGFPKQYKKERIGRL